jgi:hypothetical protein
MLGIHDHPIPRRKMAGRRETTLTFDMHEAGPACPQRRAIGVLAELRQRQFETVDRVEHGGADGNLDRMPVDGQAERRRRGHGCRFRVAEVLDVERWRLISVMPAVPIAGPSHRPAVTKIPDYAGGGGPA